MATPNPSNSEVMQTGTVRAALVTVALYLAAKHGLPGDVANAVAELVAGLGAIAVTYYLRRGVAKSGAALLLLGALFASGCCSHPSIPVVKKALENARNDYQGWIILDDLSPAQRRELAASGARTMQEVLDALEADFK